MLLAENISLAIRALISNKMRAFLTMLGIIIGIAAVIAILTVGNSLNRSVAETMQSMGANDVFVTVAQRSDEEEETSNSSSALDGIHYGSFARSSEMTDDDYITGDMIRAMYEQYADDIYAINISHTVGSASLQNGEKESGVSLMGVSVGYFVTNSVEMVEGSMFNDLDFSEERKTILVSVDTAEDLFGDNVKDAVGQDIECEVDGKSVIVTIAGVYKQNQGGGNSSMMMTSMLGGSSAYMPLRAAMNIDHSEDQYTYFQVSAKADSDPQALADKIRDFYKPYYRNNSDYRVSVITYESLLEMFYTLLGTITTAISIIAGIALLVGGIGVMNIMLVSVTERTREIGTRKALGARNSSIRAQFIVEAMIICLIGGAFGVVLGIGLGAFASNLLGYPAKPSIPGIIIALLFSMSIGLFFGYFPANKAAKMNPIDALRYE
ncbi:putative ABC transport system permease protein [Lachnospiraceae bacterium A10]|nr:putative ABC transport system permease protein [Lachnospiraceae bacterium A10]